VLLMNVARWHRRDSRGQSLVAAGEVLTLQTTPSNRVNHLQGLYPWLLVGITDTGSPRDRPFAIRPYFSYRRAVPMRPQLRRLGVRRTGSQERSSPTRLVVLLAFFGE
jgi:hypothetical protein